MPWGDGLGEGRWEMRGGERCSAYSESPQACWDGPTQNFQQVAGTRAEIVHEFKKIANIPGFRPGKAPEPMVEKRYASEIDDELRKRIIPESYRHVLAEHDLRLDLGDLETQERERAGRPARASTSP